MNTLLELRDVAAGYGGGPVIKGIDLSVGQSEYVWIRGPNGCGKSTLFRAISGEVQIYSGRIKYAGIDISDSSIEERFALGIGHLRQRGNVFEPLTVRDMWRVCFRGSATECAQRIEWLETVLPEIVSAMEQPIGLLPGGLRQIAALGAVIINKRQLLLLDEPSTGLAPTASRDVYRAVGELARRENCTILIIDHNREAVSPWPTRVIDMQLGEVVADRPGQKTLSPTNQKERS